MRRGTPRRIPGQKRYCHFQNRLFEAFIHSSGLLVMMDEIIIQSTFFSMSIKGPSSFLVTCDRETRLSQRKAEMNQIHAYSLFSSRSSVSHFYEPMVSISAIMTTFHDNQVSTCNGSHSLRCDQLVAVPDLAVTVTPPIQTILRLYPIFQL